MSFASASYRQEIWRNLTEGTEVSSKGFPTPGKVEVPTVRSGTSLSIDVFES